MSRHQDWLAQGERCGWRMHGAPWWKRLPIIRHIRALWHSWRAYHWHRYGPGSIGIPTGYDNWVIYGIWYGKERKL